MFAVLSRGDQLRVGSPRSEQAAGLRARALIYPQRDGDERLRVGLDRGSSGGAGRERLRDRGVVAGVSGRHGRSRGLQR